MHFVVIIGLLIVIAIAAVTVGGNILANSRQNAKLAQKQAEVAGKANEDAREARELLGTAVGMLQAIAWMNDSHGELQVSLQAKKAIDHINENGGRNYPVTEVNSFDR